MKDTIKLKDFLDFTYLSNLSFAPDEEHGVFVGVSVWRKITAIR
ncbi:MAG: hypothetical protein ACLRL6_08980 [Clostridium sp.]